MGVSAAGESFPKGPRPGSALVFAEANAGQSCGNVFAGG